MRLIANNKLTPEGGLTHRQERENRGLLLTLGRNRIPDELTTHPMRKEKAKDHLFNYQPRKERNPLTVEVKAP